MGLHCLLRLSVLKLRKIMIMIFTEILLLSDFNQLDEEISTIRTNLKPKVNKLRDLEHREDIKGFDLNPLSKEELNTIDSFI